MNLGTERLTIRKLKASDAEAFTQYRSDTEVCRWQSFEPFTPQESAKFIAEHQDDFASPGCRPDHWTQLGIALKRSDKLIGDIGLKPDLHEKRIVEFGVTLSPLHQKKGYAREALAAVFTELFAHHDVHRIVGITDVENAGSIALLEKMHFRREGHFIQSYFERYGDKGRWRDEFLYALLKSEFGR